MKKSNIFLFALFGGVLISLASCMPSNQKAIVQTKEKVELSLEDIVAPDILDLSSVRRKAFNKIAGFNGKTYKKTIKYYIHDKTGNVSLIFLNDLTNYAYEISDDVEQFIVDTFNKVDEAIDLDFQRVNSSRKANIVI